MRKIVGLCADTHSGNNNGLLNPLTELFQEDEHGNPAPYKPNPTAVQRVIWPIYQQGIDALAAWAGKDELVVAVLGDVASGNKYLDGIGSSRLSDQIIVSRDCFLPWLDLPNVQHMRFVSGTSAHDFGEAAADNLIVALLKERYDKDITLSSHSLLKVNGVELDLAHHGPGGGIRVWLKGNNARYYLQDIMMSSMLRGEAPPRVVVRGHHHVYVRETRTVGDYTSDLILLPSFCGMSEHARQMTRSEARITYGMVGLEIVDGKLVDVRGFVEEFDLRRREVL